MELEQTFAFSPALDPFEEKVDEEFLNATKLSPKNDSITPEVNKPLRGPNFGEEETLQLLNIWALESKRKWPYRKNQMWKVISLRMGEYGKFRTAQQCKNRVYNISRVYKKGWQTNLKSKHYWKKIGEILEGNNARFGFALTFEDINFVKSEVQNYDEGYTLAHPPGFAEFQVKIVSALPESGWAPLMEVELFVGNEEYIPPF